VNDKRKHIDDKTCLFCSKPETVLHLFFECCVARIVWGNICEITDLPLIKDFESLGTMWVKGKKFKAFNVLSSALIWLIWKMRNNICFQGVCWSKVEDVLRGGAKLIRNWVLLNKPEQVMKLEAWTQEMERRSVRPPRLTWGQNSGSSVSGGASASPSEATVSVQSLSVSGRVVNAISVAELDVLLVNQLQSLEPDVRANIVNLVSR
jgi:hypothetical protein